MFLMFGIKLFPAVKATCEARGDLRVFGVEQAGLLGKEGVAVGGVEAGEVGAEVADQ
jgi:hypothetical protein